jgi:hypothetical protein
MGLRVTRVVFDGPRYPILHQFLYLISRSLPLPGEWPGIHAAALLVSSIPFYVVVALKLWGNDLFCPPLNWWWGVDYAVLNYALLTASLYCWKRMTFVFSGPITDMLKNADLSDRVALVEWWLSCTRARLQVIWLLGGCVGATLGAFLLVNFSQGYVQRTFLTDATVILSGVVAGHSVYCIATGVLLSYKVVGIPSLNLTWNAPINTPALVEISDTARLTAQLGLLCFLLAAAPLTYVKIFTSAPAITALYLAALLTTGGFVLVVGVGVQFRLSQTVRRAKLEVLHALADRIAYFRPAAHGHERGHLDGEALSSLYSAVGVYDAVDRSPSSYLNSGVVAQYVASTAAVILQLVIPVLAK